VDWQDSRPLSATDKQDILALTRQLGFEARRVGPRPPSPGLLPLGCEPVMVETTIEVSGQRRSSKSIPMWKLDDWCQLSRPEPVKAGPWVTFRDTVYDDIKWRIQEADLTLDVRLGEDVAYEDARRIVLAIHQGKWTRSTPFERGGGPDPDSSRIQWVTRDPRLGPDYQIGFSPNGWTDESWNVRPRRFCR
jgi:hypothetical protein